MADRGDKEPEGMPEDYAAALKGYGEGMEKLIGVVRRLAAWEPLLLLFFARYYVGKSNPVGAALHDRDFLASRYRAVGDEDTARLIEANFKGIVNMVEIALSPEQPTDDGGPLAG